MRPASTILSILLATLSMLTSTQAADNAIFQEATTYPVGGSGNGIVIADFNNDGRPDVATVNGTGNSVSVLLRGVNGFRPAINTASGDFPDAIASGDFNNDGHADLVTADYGTSKAVTTVSILLGNGDGTFQPHTEYTVGSYPNGVAVGDFNRDGKPDLVVGTLKAVNIPNC